MTEAETCGGEFKRPWFLHFTAQDQERLRKKVLEYLDRENVFGDHFSEFEMLRIGDLLSVPFDAKAIREPESSATQRG